MAIFHMNVSALQRGHGRSVVATAAYRSGSRLRDDRTDTLHNYSRLTDVQHCEILLPAEAPSWASSRETLWNAAEKAERRKDSVVARIYRVALPHELTLAQGIDATRAFSAMIVERFQVAGDFSLRSDDPFNWKGLPKPHRASNAYIITSTRRLEPAGFGLKADCELSAHARRDRGLPNFIQVVHDLRALWERIGNAALVAAGFPPTLDRRSLADRGIDRDAAPHLGRAVTRRERLGTEQTYLGDLALLAEEQMRTTGA